MSKHLRRPSVCELTGLSSSSIDRYEKAGNFPRRVRLGPNTVAWSEAEVLDWLATRQRGGVETPIKAIEAVQRHHRRRRALSHDRGERS